MEELYTKEAREADTERSRVLMRGMSERERLVAMELMNISFRAGVEVGKRSVPLAAFA